LSGKPDYQSLLQQFTKEITDLDLPAFGDPAGWTLAKGLQNGVQIGYDIRSASDRKELHDIGARYGLIPLCPNDVVDLDFNVTPGKPSAVVTTAFGKLPIRPRRG
jgi:hypothetical protein